MSESVMANHEYTNCIKILRKKFVGCRLWGADGLPKVYENLECTLWRRELAWAALAHSVPLPSNVKSSTAVNERRDSSSDFSWGMLSSELHAHVFSFLFKSEFERGELYSATQSRRMLQVIEANAAGAKMDTTASASKNLFVLLQLSKYAHHVVRNLLHDEICELACRNATTLALTSGLGTFKEQFFCEKQSEAVAMLARRAYGLLAMHCAGAHCAVARRGHNSCSSIREDLKNANARGRLKLCDQASPDGMGCIRVCYERSDDYSVASDVPVAFVRNGPVIARLDAAAKGAIWSPHSEMAVTAFSNLEEVGLNLRREQGPEVVRWLAASNDGRTVLGGRGDGAYLWLCDEGQVVLLRPDLPRVETEVQMTRWLAVYGWFETFRKTAANMLYVSLMMQMAEVETMTDPPFSTVYRNFRHAIWTYEVDTSLAHVGDNVCLRCVEVSFEDVESSGWRQGGHCCSYSGDWLGFFSTVNSVAYLYERNFVDDRDDLHASNALVACVPSARMGGRWEIIAVGIAPLGDRLGMLMRGSNMEMGIEVHDRISSCSSVRSCIFKMYPGCDMSFTQTRVSTFVEFSPCGRLLMWCDGETSAKAQQPLFVADTMVVEKGYRELRPKQLNTVRENMPKQICWKRSGLWVRVRRGVLLVQS